MHTERRKGWQFLMQTDNIVYYSWWGEKTVTTQGEQMKLCLSCITSDLPSCIPIIIILHGVTEATAWPFYTFLIIMRGEGADKHASVGRMEPSKIPVASAASLLLLQLAAGYRRALCVIVLSADIKIPAVQGEVGLLFGWGDAGMPLLADSLLHLSALSVHLCAFFFSVNMNVFILFCVLRKVVTLVKGCCPSSFWILNSFRSLKVSPTTS